MKPLDKRIVKHFNKAGEDDCWEWTGAHIRKGYGMIRDANMENRLAHRVMYELFVGPIPEGMNICHICDNPKCVNPNHLYAATQSQNIQDAYSRNRMFYKQDKCLIMNIRSDRDSGMLLREISAKYSVPMTTVARYCKG